MDDQIPKLTQLVSSIPKIVITEPTPLRERTEVGASTATSSAVESVPKTDNDVPTTSDDSRQDSDDFQDPDCELDENRFPPKPAEVVVDVNDQVSEPPSGRERNEAHEDDFRNSAMENCFERCMAALAWFNESKYMLVVLFLLLAIPISAGFMGAQYLDKCPLSSETPIFLFMMGIAGTVVLVCRILLVSQKILLPARTEWQVPKVIVIVGNLAIVVCLATEMYAFLRTLPSFEIGSAHYCHPTFYTYTYWANFTSVIVITLLMILQLPSCIVDTP